MDKIFVSYKDEKEKIISGYFELLEKTKNYLEIKTSNGNIFIIPYHRIIKVKKHSMNNTKRRNQ